MKKKKWKIKEKVSNFARFLKIHFNSKDSDFFLEPMLTFLKKGNQFWFTIVSFPFSPSFKVKNHRARILAYELERKRNSPPIGDNSFRPRSRIQLEELVNKEAGVFADHDWSMQPPFFLKNDGFIPGMVLNKKRVVVRPTIYRSFNNKAFYNLDRKWNNVAWMNQARNYYRIFWPVRYFEADQFFYFLFFFFPLLYEIER